MKAASGRDLRYYGPDRLRVGGRDQHVRETPALDQLGHIVGLPCVVAEIQQFRDVLPWDATAERLVHDGIRLRAFTVDGHQCNPAVDDPPRLELLGRGTRRARAVDGHPPRDDLDLGSILLGHDLRVALLAE